LTQGPHGLGDLGERGLGIRQLGLQVIDPLIKIVGLFAKFEAWINCLQMKG
jgi:hypothetical protein